jgi:hypothetical protein
LRGLAHVLARDLGPQGIHVAHQHRRAPLICLPFISLFPIFQERLCSSQRQSPGYVLARSTSRAQRMDAGTQVVHIWGEVLKRKPHV